MRKRREGSEWALGLGLGPQGSGSLLCSQTSWGVPSTQGLALGWTKQVSLLCPPHPPHCVPHRGGENEHMSIQFSDSLPGRQHGSDILSSGLSTGGAVRSWGTR